jgi:heme-degrading monooxygenase HmoA
VSGRTNFAHLTVKDWEEAKCFAESAGFPEHFLIVRPGDEHHPDFRKGLSDWDSLQDAVNWALASSTAHQAFIETDMRAFANPTRMQNIRRAAEALAQKLQSLCPACGAPGFAKSGVIRGLPCEDCGQSTEEVKADIHRCVRCDYQSVVDREIGFAAPRYCGYCNP